MSLALGADIDNDTNSDASESIRVQALDWTMDMGTQHPISDSRGHEQPYSCSRERTFIVTCVTQKGNRKKRPFAGLFSHWTLVGHDHGPNISFFFYVCIYLLFVCAILFLLFQYPILVSLQSSKLNKGWGARTNIMSGRRMRIADQRQTAECNCVRRC